jgi:uncharacterized protein YaaN involved in tellurite resistance
MTTLTPPDEDDQVFVLKAPEPTPVVAEEEGGAVGFLDPVPENRKLEIGQQAKGFVKDISKFNANSPEFAAKLADINSLAQAEIVKSGNGASRMLERKTTSVNGSKKKGGDAQVAVAKTLSELRSTVTDLTPNAADLTGVRKILGFIPGGSKIQKYFHKYESAQVQLDQIVKSLLAGQDELLKDNASLQQERKELWDTMNTLNEYNILAEQLDNEVSSQVVALRNAGNVTAANALDSDMLFAIRQRRQDLVTQLGVAVQGYMAMGLIRQNNIELIKGVERARTTTLYALRTAVAVSEALSTQKLVLDQIDAVNSVTNKTIEQTSIMLRQQTARVHEQSVNSGVSAATLEKAFDNIFATMDEIETFRAKANDTMAVTIGALESQLERARPQLDRARALESAESNNGRTAIGQ